MRINHSFDSHNNPSSYSSYNYPSGYTYVEGFGFASPPPAPSEKRRIFAYSNGIGLSLVATCLIWTILPNALFHIFSFFLPILDLYDTFPQMVSSAAECIQILCNILVYAIPFGIYLVFHHIPVWAAFPLKPLPFSSIFPPILLGLGVSVLGVFASTLISTVCWFFLGLQPVGGSVSIPSDPIVLSLLFIRSALIAPIMEEFVFRGVILQSLRRFGDAFALMCSAILFSLAHQNLIQAPNAFMFGLVIGYFVIRTGSLWIGILIHIVNNFLALSMTIIAALLPHASQNLLILVWYALCLGLGILGLLMLVRKNNEMFSLRRSSTISIEHGKYKTFFSSPGMIICLVMFTFLFTQNFV